MTWTEIRATIVLVWLLGMSTWLLVTGQWVAGGMALFAALAWTLIYSSVRVRS
jgi:hypothetical protein